MILDQVSRDNGMARLFRISMGWVKDACSKRRLEYGWHIAGAEYRWGVRVGRRLLADLYSQVVEDE